MVLTNRLFWKENCSSWEENAALTLFVRALGDYVVHMALHGVTRCVKSTKLLHAGPG